MIEGDAEAVSALLAGSWERTYAPLMGAEKVAAQNETKHGPDILKADLKRPHSESFVAIAGDGSVVGYAYAIVVKGVLWLDRLHVAPEQQGSGIAANLLRAVMANYVGEPSISLEVIEGNERAIRFYEKQGFETVERKGACGNIDGVPTLVMRRALSRA
jgi:ribosomal protein S18 acetylase RimI-like enzyme